jgi:hypothetical protein
LDISFLSYYAYKIWASKSPEYQFSDKITKALLGLILVSSIIIVIPQLVTERLIEIDNLIKEHFNVSM